MQVMKCLVVASVGALLATTSAMADPQTHGADYKMRGMTESRGSQAYANSNYNSAPAAASAPVIVTQAPPVAQQPTVRRSFSVEPSVKAPCGPQPAPPAPVAKRQPQPTERRAMSVEPTPVQTFNYTPSNQFRSFERSP